MHASPTLTSPRGTPSRRGKSPLVRSHSPAGSGSGSPSAPAINSMRNNSTFTSCTRILVEGAIPIETDRSSEPAATQQQSGAGDSKRAPRKSKTDALAALQTHAQTSSNDDIEMSDSESDVRFNNYARPIPVSPTLNLESVKTRSPRNVKPGGNSRPFGLQDCPIFHPTTDEFKDPMTYIRSISTTAQNYGICKVVPPEGWNMPFVTDTEVCHCFQRISDSELNRVIYFS